METPSPRRPLSIILLVAFNYCSWCWDLCIFVQYAWPLWECNIFLVVRSYFPPSESMFHTIDTFGTLILEWGIFRRRGILSVASFISRFTSEFYFIKISQSVFCRFLLIFSDYVPLVSHFHSWLGFVLKWPCITTVVFRLCFSPLWMWLSIILSAPVRCGTLLHEMAVSFSSS